MIECLYFSSNFQTKNSPFFTLSEEIADQG